ncbi:MAG: hypothetical protein J6J74_06220 [Elusimicrobiaceae bacterium]|nr:hypothetical protein [Elusimicrobiaceae bacterium]MBP3514056.1 hypothetical protein [Elusimicrobiaceae bacterium]
MLLTLYKWKEVLIKSYLSFTRGCGYAFSYWPYVSVRETQSGLEVLFKGKKLFSALPLAHLQKPAEDVYILASGPSVQTQDLKYLAGKNVITLNGSVSAAAANGFVPFLHLISDANFILKRPQLVESVPAGVPVALSLSAVKAAAVFVPDLFCGRELFPILNPLEKFPLPPISADRLPRDKFRINYSGTSAFSLDPAAGLQDGGSVLTIALQLAYFLQFKRVFLLGFDIGNAAEPRFYETKKNRVKCGLLKDYEQKILPFMKLAAEVYHAAGREIYNCSPVSKLPYEVVPYRKFPAKRK